MHQNNFYIKFLFIVIFPFVVMISCPKHNFWFWDPENEIGIIFILAI
jgi:hypothetical protein